MAKEDEDFENCGKCLNCDNAYVDGFDEVRDDCDIRKMLFLIFSWSFWKNYQ